MTTEPRENETDDYIKIAPSILESKLLISTPPSPRSLRVCCYGSSSSQTPELYLQEARHVGYLLAKRGHVCVNGAGQFGCMAALNDGASKGNGHIVGVIHEMFLLDQGEDGGNSSWTTNYYVPARDGGAHGVFANTKSKSKNGASPLNVTTDGPIREMLVAGGKDLQERKRLLMQGADALLVLPGGPGTWDELWEAACARGIGLTDIPIVVVNPNGYYDPFWQMMERAYNEGLTKLTPDELIHFETSAEGAIQWIETHHLGEHYADGALSPHASRTVIRKSSMMTIPPLGQDDSWLFGSLQRSLSRLMSRTDDKGGLLMVVDEGAKSIGNSILCFAVGVAAGAMGCSLALHHYNRKL